jgi:hypothetical protein
VTQGQRSGALKNAYVPYMHAPYVCLTCMPYMYAVHVCLICIEVLTSKKSPISSGAGLSKIQMYLTCMPHMYALHACLICIEVLTSKKSPISSGEGLSKNSFTRPSNGASAISPALYVSSCGRPRACALLWYAHMYALCVCLMCMPCVYALCVCLVCMSYMYALFAYVYVCLV